MGEARGFLSREGLFPTYLILIIVIIIVGWKAEAIFNEVVGGAPVEKDDRVPELRGSEIPRLENYRKSSHDGNED